MAIILALFLFFLFLIWIWRRTQKTAPQKILPPKAGGAWPVIGHLHLLGGTQPAHITLGDMADKNGPIFSINLGMHRAIVVSSSKIAKECFTTNDKVFANRPKALATELMGYNYAMFGLSPYGSYWRHMRKIATLELLSNHRIEMFKHIRESEINTAIKEIYMMSAKNNNALVEMKRWFGYVALNVLLMMVIKKRFAWAATKDENEGNDQRHNAMRDLVVLSGTFVASDVLPYLRWLDLSGYEKAMKKTAKKLDTELEGWLEEHKQRRISGGVKKGHQDFMDVMLSIVDDSEVLSSYDADTITKATCLHSERPAAVHSCHRGPSSVHLKPPPTPEDAGDQLSVAQRAAEILHVQHQRHGSVQHHHACHREFSASKPQQKTPAVISSTPCTAISDDTRPPPPSSRCQLFHAALFPQQPPYFHADERTDRHAPGRTWAEKENVADCNRERNRKKKKRKEKRRAERWGRTRNRKEKIKEKKRSMRPTRKATKRKRKGKKDARCWATEKETEKRKEKKREEHDSGDARGSRRNEKKKGRKKACGRRWPNWKKKKENK